MTPLEQAQNYFAGDRFATENGATIVEIGETMPCAAWT